MTSSSVPDPPRLRRTAGDRRAQLVQIGLELLPTTPVQELTIDEVARRAGISRSLLFHYFATKREYYTAVTRAAADLMLEHLLPPAGTPREEQVTGMLDRYVGWVETFRETHLAFVRGPPEATPGSPRSTRTPGTGWSASRCRLSRWTTTPCAGSSCWPGSPSPRTWWVSGRSSRRCPVRSCWTCSATCWTASRHARAVSRPGPSEHGRPPRPAGAATGR